VALQGLNCSFLSRSVKSCCKTESNVCHHVEKKDVFMAQRFDDPFEN
jgi:hypothetical protein